MSYYLLWIDENIPGWTLSISEEYADGTRVDIWAFSRCEAFAGQVPVPFRISEDGPVVDYNMTAFGAIVVSTRLADAFSSLAGEEIQRIPVRLESPGQWEILNVLQRVDCIDYGQSIVQYYPTDHPDRSRAGKPRGIARLRIQEEPAGGRHLFRPTNWEVDIIASDAVKRLVLDGEFTGMDFRRVS
jgi:hypothetical protein